MKNVRFPLALIASSLVAASSLQAQTTATTEPVGFVTVPVTSGAGGARKQTLLSIPLLNVDSTITGLSAGSITAVSSNSIVVTNAGWTAAELSDPAAPMVIQITSGSAAGRFFLVASSANTGGASGNAALANTTTNLFVSPIDSTQISNNLASAGLVAGDTFKLYACPTLSSAFDPVKLTAILRGTNAAVADNIILTVNGTPTTYYPNANGVWVRAAINSAATNVAIVPSYGLTYGRLGTNDLSFIATGQVPATNRIASIKNSGTTVLSQYWPVSSTLRSLGIQDLPGWTKGTNQVSTDNVVVIANSTPTTYYYNGTNWRRFPLTANQDNVQIPIGSAVQIIKKGSTSGYSTLSQPLPYQLN